MTGDPSPRGVVLARRRAQRYRGDDRAVALSAFGDSDRETVVSLYAALRDLRAAAEGGDGPLAAHLAGAGLDEVVSRVQRLGRDGAAPELRHVVHDVRGGALNALVLQIGRPRRRSLPPHWASSVALLARDHMKVMRGLVEGLDPEARARDLAPIPHSLSTIVEALRNYPCEADGVPLSLVIRSEFEATIAESCVECGAIDRCTYNLLGNAARHAVPPEIGVSFLEVGADLRVEVDNRVEEAHAAALARVLAGGASPLFGAFSTTGSGDGLAIVASLVGSAYGIPSPEELVAEGHVGVHLADGRFVAWFHWPLAGA